MMLLDAFLNFTSKVLMPTMENKNIDQNVILSIPRF